MRWRDVPIEWLTQHIMTPISVDFGHRSLESLERNRNVTCLGLEGPDGVARDWSFDSD